MNRITAFALLLTVAVVSGCSTHHAVEQRPFSAEESRQLALEDLNRRGLSFDEYQARKTRLLAEPQFQQVREFDRSAEVNVEVSVIGQDRQG